MTERTHISIRCESMIDTSDAAVRRALRTSDVWVRAARAVGGRLDIAGGRADLLSASLVRFRGWRLTRPMLFGVRESAGLPVLESANPRSKVQIRIGLTVAPAAAGTRTGVEFVVPAGLPILAPALRPILLRFGEMLLAVATLVAREPVRVVAGALIVEGRVLLAQRKSTGDAAGKWELPGGKVEPGETDRQALQRELSEELGLRTKVSGRIGPTIEVDQEMHLYCYRAEVIGTDPVRLVDHDQYRWVGPHELDSVDLLESDRQLIHSLREVLAP